MKIIKAPEPLVFNGRSLFLAGSIEMGKAVNWQEQVTKKLKGNNITILNPRRDDWDSSWKQSIHNRKFNEQVTWELRALEKCDIIALYFDPKTKSPISLLEFGLFAKAEKLVVFCPKGFWRKGNVDIVCAMYGIHQANSMKEFITLIKYYLYLK